MDKSDVGGWVEGLAAQDAADGERASESPSASHSPAMARLLGTDTPEGAARFDRVARAREAGYDGPLDQDGRRPDMSRPENQVMGAALDDMARRTAARMAAEAR